jgi:hypothetical protein
MQHTENLTLHELIELLPENTPLYKDSGLWQLRSDDMEEVFVQQVHDESFFEFLKRCIQHSKNNETT